MDTYTILNIASFAVVLFSLFFAFFLFTVKTDNKLGNRILGIFLVLNAIEISSFFYHRFIDMPMVLEMIRMDLPIANQPLFYFFVLSLVYTDFRFKKVDLLHFIPYLVSFLVLIPRFYSADQAGKEDYFSYYLQNPETQFMIAVSYVQSVVYTVIIFIVLARVRRISLENYSSLHKSNIKWLFQLNILSCIIFIIVTCKTLYKYISDEKLYLNELRIIIVVLVLLYTLWLILKALYKPEVFKGVESKQKSVQSLITEVRNTEPPEKETQSRIDFVRAHMRDQKPFLNPNLTIQALANEVSLPVTELSILINHHMGKHFFDFINEYRVNEAKEILKNPTDEKMTILEILYQVGFNSKSSFNTAFKKYTSTTPTQFRKLSNN